LNVEMDASERDRLARLEALADEQAAFRRIATLIAEGASTATVGAAVLEEATRVMQAPAAWLVRYEPDDSILVVASLNDPTFPPGSRWPLDGDSVSSLIRDTGRPVRVDDYSQLQGTLAEKTLESEIVSVAGAPVVVDGEIWGAVCVGAASADELSIGAEDRLAEFTQLIATDLSNAAARERLAGLLQEQAALRRVATLVAQEAPPDELFSAVAEEVGRVLGLPSIEIVRFDAGRAGTVIGASGQHPFPVGSRSPLVGPSVRALVYETGAPARIDDFAGLDGPVAEASRRAGLRSAIGAPIVVDNRTWGAIVAATRDSVPVPIDAEGRLADFTRLVATAVSNLQAHDDLTALAEEQAALRRVATLVAEGADTSAVFDAVCAEAGALLDATTVNLSHYTRDDFNTTVAGWSLRDTHVPAGASFPITPDTVAGEITRTRAAARVDSWESATSELARLVRERGIKSSVGAPVIVEGELWGALVAATDRAEPLALGTEDRLARFTDLIATAISGSAARDGERRLAEEQAALRRVATLVAEGAAPSELFAAVTDEVANVLRLPSVVLERYEADSTVTVLATAGQVATWNDAGYTVGTRWPIDGPSVVGQILQTGRSATITDYSSLPGTMAGYMQAAAGAAAVGVPIVVDGKLWGAMSACTTAHHPALPADLAVRLTRFTELVATAVSNATARADLIESRARLVAAGDEARRRIERDLHDGTQQRLIALGLDLQRIRSTIADDPAAAAASLERTEADLQVLLEEVRQLSSSLHPPLLSLRGFVPALRSLARRSSIPVDIDVELRDRPPPAIESALYYVASEAITNAMKHSQAKTISVIVETDHVGWPFGIGIDGRRTPGNIYATIVDDGVGGADVTGGSGLSGLIDRVDALGGRFTLDSVPGNGTRISVVLPLDAS
jgi:signal transduction histidine kinase